MLTSLPNLPFPTIGISIEAINIDSEPLSSSSPRPSLRTDLKTVKRWISFENDITNAIHTVNDIPNGTQIEVGNTLSEQTVVENEELLRAHAHLELHSVVAGVLRRLGYVGRFYGSGSDSGVVGDPDFVWIDSEGVQPKLVVEYKTEWVADLIDIDVFSKSESRANEEALEQVYGYMVFNKLRYGVLSNWTRAWFLRRVEDGVVECAGPVEVHGDGSMSILKAFVGMTLMARGNWFCASRTFAIGDSAKAESGSYDVGPTQCTYPCLNLDFRQCDFQLSTARHSKLASVVHANLLFDPPLVAVCKVVDVVRHSHGTGRSVLESEARVYAALQHLQGDVIPKLYGYYNIWGILELLALEPVGVAIPNDDAVSENVRKKMREALGKIHAAGYLHGDIARRNFCWRDSDEDGRVFMVDLERSRQSGCEVEKAVEMDLINSL